MSIGERPLSNIRFTEDINLMAGSNSDLQALRSSSADGVETSSDKGEVIVNTVRQGKAEVCLSDVHSVEVRTFKYVGAMLFKDGSCVARILITALQSR